MSHDTIAAISTATGRAGIGIVRVSGAAAHNIGKAVTALSLEPGRFVYTSFLDVDAVPVDYGVVLYFKAPGSYTGEDVLELQGHGGPAVLDLLLQRCLSLGARLARPGEFTERAFLNDKLDLAQAEAISDLI
ncbi:MAG: tRNA uridine-5-carboxymethylaminomethyl(34) synthesis GTPase MnmE, partial [Aestuariivirgaceae bacterium]